MVTAGWRHGPALIARMFPLVLAVVTASLAQAQESFLSACASAAASAGTDLANAETRCPASSNPASSTTTANDIELWWTGSGTNLSFSGRALETPDISRAGMSLTAKHAFSGDWTAGWALVASSATDSLTSSRVRDPAEPIVYRLESSSAGFDATASGAIRWKFLALGAGVSLYPRLSAKGRVDMDQRVSGSSADGLARARADLRFAPLVGVHLQTRALHWGLVWRAAQRRTITTRMRGNVALSGNPLNGTSDVVLQAQTALKPQRWEVGLAWVVDEPWRVAAAVVWERWGLTQVRLPSTEVHLDLGLTPDVFDAAPKQIRGRDTISPRLSLQGPVPWTSGRGIWTMGSAYIPAAFDPPENEATLLDTDRVWFTLATHWSLGSLAGMDWHVDAMIAKAWWRTMSYRKPDPTLPFAVGELSGSSWNATLGLGGAW